ncbi:MAG: hypothetical protein ACRD3W_32175, partial [Terriglobales bacterium]
MKAFFEQTLSCAQHCGWPRSIATITAVSFALVLTAYISPAKCIAENSKSTDLGGGISMSDSRPALAKHWIVGTVLSPPT